MAKLLIRRTPREIIYVASTNQDYHCKYGRITKEDLEKPDGSVILSHMGTEFIILTASFADNWERLKRIPQSMIAKDIGAIISTCGIGKESTIMEAGTGNGSLTAQLAHIAKHIISHEQKESHHENAKKNLAKLGITNVTLHNTSVTEAQDEVDVLILDVPEPWELIETAKRCIRIGGWLVTYSPSITQVHQTYTAMNDEWLWDKTVEIIERPWKIAARIARPDNMPIGHTAFLSFIRKLH